MSRAQARNCAIASAVASKSSQSTLWPPGTETLVTVPSELEVATIVWAQSVLVTEAALPLVEGRAS